ncbi:MAG: hypothetical protein HDR35_05630 [Treponema sp.]|nr:hypothetical protein [Treponema sp.]
MKKLAFLYVLFVAGWGAFASPVTDTDLKNRRVRVKEPYFNLECVSYDFAVDDTLFFRGAGAMTPSTEVEKAKQQGYDYFYGFVVNTEKNCFKYVEYKEKVRDELVKRVKCSISEKSGSGDPSEEFFKNLLGNAFGGLIDSTDETREVDLGTFKSECKKALQSVDYNVAEAIKELESL